MVVEVTFKMFQLVLLKKKDTCFIIELIKRRKSSYIDLLKLIQREKRKERSRNFRLLIIEFSVFMH